LTHTHTHWIFDVLLRFENSALQRRLELKVGGHISHFWPL